MNLHRYILLIVVACIAGCTKLVEVDPPVTNDNSANVYNNNTTAAAVLSGIYTKMSDGDIDAFAKVSSAAFFTGLAADELILFEQGNPVNLAYATNNLTPVMIDGSHFWTNIYQSVFVANSAIEGLTLSSGLTPAVKDQLLGEAKFIRAFLYFYLVNFYGDVPLVLYSDYKQNSVIGRTAVSNVYEQIVADLKDAHSLLSENYLNGDILSISQLRVRPNKYAASALLARVYLYMNEYSKAYDASTEVINNTAMYQLVPLNEAFLNSSREAIWQLFPTGVGESSNSAEGRIFVLNETGPSIMNPVYLNVTLYNSFEEGDLRKTNWINVVSANGTNYCYPYKYKIGRIDVPSSEYSTVLRLAEQYLIRAEAAIHLNKPIEAIDDLNTIRLRATDLTAPVANQLPELDENMNFEQIKAAIEDERRHEFFTEYGHRWLDLKRTGRANTVLGPLKGANWQPEDQLFPIPQTDINRNPALRDKQNPGYN